MIKIYRIKEDGKLKEFFCNTQAEADEKLKLDNYVSESGAEKQIPDIIIEDVKPDDLIPDFEDESEADNA